MNVWLTERLPTHWKEQMLLRFFKKGNDNEKENYLPVSMLSTFWKEFEKLLFEQINDHIQSKFSKHLTSFRKNHSTQNALLVMIEKWKTILNEKFKVGAPFMDLSMAFDTLDHSLLLAKLSAYGFHNNSLSFVQSYLTNRIQRCKIENHFRGCIRCKNTQLTSPVLYMLSASGSISFVVLLVLLVLLVPLVV